MSAVIGSEGIKGQHNNQQLIEQFGVLVKRLAQQLLRKLPHTVLLEDLIQAGMIGLLEAAQHYDPAKGASFETYASIRIRGSMLDELRRNDWLPRSAYHNARTISQAVHRVENRVGHDARDHEVAAELGLSLSEYHQLLQDTAHCQLFDFEDLAWSVDFDQLNNCRNAEPFASVQRDDLDEKLMGVIKLLPEKERLVMLLYYKQDLNLKEIGIIIGVGESRACQIHHQAMQHIKDKLYHWQ